MRPNLENKIINLMIRLQTYFVITFYLFYFDGIAMSPKYSRPLVYTEDWFQNLPP